MDPSMGKRSRSYLSKHPVGMSLLLLVSFVDIGCSSLNPMVVSSIEEISKKVSLESVVERKHEYRLPKAVEPILYSIELKPYFHNFPTNFTYTGYVVMRVNCTHETNNVTFNLNGPTVDTSTLRVVDLETRSDDVLKVISSTENKKHQFFTIFLSGNMTVGKLYDIVMNFSGIITSSNEGLFYKSYKRGNETKYLLATDFEPTNARKVFPCFDEPAMKARFRLMLYRPVGYYSLSNVVKTNTTLNMTIEGHPYEADNYMEAHDMSTYSLAFVIFDFPHEQTTTLSGVNVTVFGAQNPELDMLYSLHLAANLTSTISYYLETQCPLKKIDFVGVNSELDNTANWGINIYSQSALQYNDTHFNLEDKENVARAVSYGAVHTWIGNFVTPAWWDDLWLKEGLAGFFQLFGMIEKSPEMKTLELFIMDKLHYALEEDAKVYSSPVYRFVDEPEEIAAMSNWVNSRKAPSLVRMLQNFLGGETFMNGVVSYVKKYAKKSANHDEFFAELDEKAKLHLLTVNVKDIMDTWILQKGYPVVTVSQDINNPLRIHVTQERFMSDPTAIDMDMYPAPFNYRWTIPLTFTSSSNTSFEQAHNDIYWLDKRERTALFSLPGLIPSCDTDDSWILANVQQMGFYRVNYQHGNWRALSRQLQRNHRVIHKINRAQIINDAWHLTRALYIPIDIALSTIKYLDDELDYLPWFTASIELRYLNFMLIYSEIYGSYQQFMQAQLSKPFQYIGPPTTTPSPIDPFLQTLITEQACYFGNDTCVTETSRLYRDLMDNPGNNTIPLNLRKAVYCQAIASGEWDEFEFAMTMYQEAESDSVKDILIYSMACSTEPWILNHYLHTLLENDATYTYRHAEAILTLVGLNPIGRYLSWDFYRVNYKLLSTKYQSLQCRKFLPVISEYFNTKMELLEMGAFLLEECISKDTEPLENILANIEENIAWMQTSAPSLRLFLGTDSYLK